MGHPQDRGALIHQTFGALKVVSNTAKFPTRGRFVEDQSFRPMAQSTREYELSLLPGRHLTVGFGRQFDDV